MSIEASLAALTAAVNANTEALGRLLAAQGSGQVSHTPAQAAAAPVQQAAQPAPVAQQMPAPPNFGMPGFAAPVQQAAQPAAPFTTPQQLFEYTGAAYQSMGAEKGSKIMGILQGMGISNLNDLKPEQYGAFYQAVEALKVSA